MDIFNTENNVYAIGGTAIGKIVLNRPNKHNAMNQAMWEAIPVAVDALNADQAVRVIVVTSTSEKAFSAGADLEELEKIASDPARGEANRLAIRNAQRDLARSAKPTIAMIKGVCVGGGCGLALHCDLRFASKGSRFGITPAKLGLIYPLNDTRTLVELVGPSHAKTILFTGRLVAGEEALRIGLIDGLHAPEELESETMSFAEQVANVSQYSVRGIKSIIRRVLDGQLDDDDATAQMFIDAGEGEDAAEGVRAFLEKRPADFKWNG